MKMGAKIALLWLTILLIRVVAAAAAQAASGAKLGCPEKCGSVSVPYPFGLGENPSCFKDQGFKLVCNSTHFNPPSLFLDNIRFLNISVVQDGLASDNLPMAYNIQFLNISVQDGLAIVNLPMAYYCHEESGKLLQHGIEIDLTGSPFTISKTLNKFTTIGCDTLAIVTDIRVEHFGTACASLCMDPKNATDEGSCSGVGCCQTSIPKNLKSLRMHVRNTTNNINIRNFSPCGYAFLADQRRFNFSMWNLSCTPEKMPNSLMVFDSNTSEKKPYSQVVFDWAIGDKTCEKSQSICGPNSDCSNPSNGAGYRCNCSEGYQGNPYLSEGCQDIDECLDPVKYPCKGSCQNQPGNYTCRCPFGMQGDGKEGCSLSTAITIVIVIVMGVLFVIVILCICWVFKKKIKEKNFQQNGGLLLRHQRVQLLSAAVLEKATNHYDSRQLLGQGGNGSVYRGLLSDKKEVAVKQSKVVDKNQIKQFLNEVEIVSQINHRNVVKLVGLCLETKVPLLVYELVSNGTLFKHIHDKKSTILNSWRICLRIAAETARALDYMHSYADPPIIHRDVKSSNILLDDKLTAKVSDFGASILIPLDQTLAPSEGQGTFGYLDPEYLQTGELTVKSDVYSFGVVLMELLTREKPFSREISGKDRSIVKVFTSSIKENRLDQILKVGDVDEQEMGQIHVVAELAKKCVTMPSNERPTMTEVADVLDSLKKENEPLQVQGSHEETESLLGVDHFMISFDTEL